MRIHEDRASDPGLWWGSRLAVHPAFRSQGRLGATLIRLAVTSAHARGCHTFLAHVQAQNLPLFRRLHWTPLQAETLHGRPHWLMQAQLDHYPPCYDVYTGFVTRAQGATAWPVRAARGRGGRARSSRNAAAPRSGHGFPAARRPG